MSRPRAWRSIVPVVTSERAAITVQDVLIEWLLDEGDLRFFGLSSVLFWTNPSVYRMLAPLVEEVGVEMFRLLVAQSSSLGTDEDHDTMVTKLGATFEEGFLAWGRAVTGAGWGVFELPAFDRASGTAVVRVVNPWELRMQQGAAMAWGCPFLLGKVIGIFGHALGQACWADEVVDTSGPLPAVEFRLYPSERTIDAELAELRRARQAAREAELLRRVEEASEALRRKTGEVEEQRHVIQALSAPIIQVWSGVLVVPLVGELTEGRAERLSGELLERVTALRARDVILDLTGLGSVDAEVADHLARTIGSMRLVGARCTVVGLSPRAASELVDLGLDFGAVRTLQTLADALRTVVGLTRAR